MLSFLLQSLASRFGHSAVAGWLDGTRGFTALHFAAAAREHKRVLEMLKEGADPAATAFDGRTPQVVLVAAPSRASPAPRPSHQRRSASRVLRRTSSRFRASALAAPAADARLATRPSLTPRI